MTLGQRIAQIRAGLGLSQEEFAGRLGTTRQTVSRWELDQALPEIAKIVQISRLFSVTTDSILREGIDTFDEPVEAYPCGIYRSPRSEVVETEKFTLEYYCRPQKDILGTRLYVGYKEKKRLTAVCERDQTAERTKYAFSTADGTVVSNDTGIAALLGRPCDPSVTRAMHRLERFFVDHSGQPLPRVSEAGIPQSLAAWRRCAVHAVTDASFFFTLCTDRTEYVFSIVPEQEDNVYCGISNNTVFDLGLYGGAQYFRIRNYGDNSRPFCGFGCDFSFMPQEIRVPTESGTLQNPQNEAHLWCVKRYTDDEIVLAGCGDDEYVYKRTGPRAEQYTTE